MPDTTVAMPEDDIAHLIVAAVERGAGGVFSAGGCTVRSRPEQPADAKNITTSNPTGG